MVSAVKQQSENVGGSVIDVLRALLTKGDDDAIVALVVKLMSTHDKQLRSMLEKAKKSSTQNEGVDTAQLLSLFGALKKLEVHPTTQAANDALAGHVGPTGPTGPQFGPKKPPPRKRPIPESLPRVPNKIVVPAVERACPVCGADRTCIGHEVTQVIDIEPARVIVREDRREKLACTTCEGQIVTAPLGDKVIEGGAYGSRLVADLVVGKYEDGLPLYRQHEQLERLGLDMPESSMGDQIAWATELLKPVADQLFSDVLGSDTMHMDGTSLKVLDKDHKDGIKLGSLWGYVGVDVRVKEDVAYEERRAAYIYTTTGKKVGQKKGELGPEDVLELRRAREMPFVCADAAGLFNAAFAKPGLIELGCNMHGRRYFKKALDGKDVRASLPIAAFKKLYDIEERIKGKPPNEKLVVRQSESKPVYDELLAWCGTYKKSEPPSSLLGKAVRYLTNHHEALMRYLSDGALPIDNGVVERLHKKVAVGRRNWLFAGSDAGGERAAVAFTVLGTCRLLGINPIDYLADVLPRLARGITVARDLPALMPAAWARARS